MEKSRSIKLNETSYFLLKELRYTINDENDLKRYIKSNMQCIDRLYGDEKFDYTNKYIEKVISTDLKLENITLLVLNCNDGESKKNFSFDMAQSFASINKKTLLIVFDSEKLYERCRNKFRFNKRKYKRNI